MSRARPSLPLKKVANGDIWLFIKGDWSQECCHDSNMVGVILFLFTMYISGAKLLHCSNVSGDILDSVFFV